MNPVATSDAAFRGGACPTPEYTIAYTGNYTTSADANFAVGFPQFIFGHSPITLNATNFGPFITLKICPTASGTLHWN